VLLCGGHEELNSIFVISTLCFEEGLYDDG
jgi:hypothetical protein